MVSEGNAQEVLCGEAAVLGGYILGHPPDEKIIFLYCEAMRKLAVRLGEKEQRILRFAIKYPSCIGLVDAGIAFSMRESGLRRRLLVMFAIVECSPDHCDLFLPRKRSPLYAFRVLLSAGRAVAFALAGAALVKLV